MVVPSTNDDFTVTVDKEYEIAIVSKAASFRGALVRFDGQGRLEEAGQNAGISTACTNVNAVGFGHVDNDDKTRVAGFYVVTGGTSLVIDVTVVEANTNGVSVYSYQRFRLTVVPAACPAPAPPPGGGGGLCFSGENMVSVQGKGPIRLDSLEIGDYVPTSGSASASYSRVYGFLHMHRQWPVEYLQFSFGNNTTNYYSHEQPLGVSAKHLLFSHGKTIAAGQVKVGDVLDAPDGSATLLVTGIATVRRNGVYAPATESGEIVVSGVRASNYVQLLTTTSSVMLLFDHHDMSHALMAPIRFRCRIHFGWCRNETYTEEGYSH